MGTRRHAAGHLFEQAVGVDAEAPGNQLLLRAERVAEPAHGQAGEEADGLRLRHAGNDVRVNANIHLRVSSDFRQINHLLPESAAEHRRLPGAHHAEAQAAELDVAAAHHHRSARAQPALRRRRVGHRSQYAAGLFDRREYRPAARPYPAAPGASRG